MGLFSTKKRYKLFFLFFLLFYGTQIFAQGSITGVIKDQEQAGASFATVSILAQADSSKISSIFSDEQGMFNIKNVPYGRYFLLISKIGFEPVHTKSFEINKDAAAYNAGTISLMKSANSLKEVAIKSSRPVMEKRADRYILNVSASTYQSSDLLDIFKALPFMDVDKDVVSMNGKSNLLILVDNIPRSKETLSAVFQSLSGQDIEKIEFINSPSAQYDGSADAVINIITKKGQLLGFTGYVRGTVSQGVYANGNGGFSFTQRTKKLVINGTANFNGGNFLVENYGYRVLTLPGKTIVLNETPHDLFKTQTFSGVLGLEYTLSPNHTLGAQVDGNFRDMLNGTTWNNRIEFSNTVGGKADSVLLGLQHANSKTNIVNYSLNYQGKLDTLGKKISGAFVYTPLNKRTVNEMQYQHVVDPSGNILNELPVVRNTNPSHSSIVVTQVDAELPFKNRWQINAGIKLNFSELKSDPYQEALSKDNNWTLIPDYSFDNLYNERIIASYVGVQKALGKFSFNASVREEKTMMAVKGVYERNFTNFFPSVLLQQVFSPDYQMALSYKRSINRPSFMELTPYRIYLDDYTVLEGNPGLKPQYTDAINVNANIKGKLFFDFDYTSSKNTFSQMPMLIDGITVWQVINYNADNYSGTVNYNYRIFPWWQGNTMLRGTYYKTDGLLNDELISRDGLSLLAGINNTYSLPYDLKLDVGFNYRTPRPYGLATSRARSFARVA